MKSIKTGFMGMRPAALDFFKELAENNNKPWFDEHRNIYESEIREPLKLLLSEMGSLFAEKNLAYIADPRRSMFRINRDIRFSKDKSPYKTNVGLFFPYTMHQTVAKPVEALGFYYHFETSETFVAGGIHSPQPVILKALREHIAANWEEFDKLINDKELKKEYPNFYSSDSLKTMPRGFPADHPAGKYLKMKEYTLFCNIKHEESYSRSLIDLLLKKAIALKPFLDFLMPAFDYIEQ